MIDPSALRTVRSLAHDLVTKVDTPAVNEVLAAFESASRSLEPTDPEVALWLLDEHGDGTVLAFALIASGDPSSSPLARQVLLEQYVGWALRLAQRIDSVRGGQSTAGQYLTATGTARSERLEPSDGRGTPATN